MVNRYVRNIGAFQLLNAFNGRRDALDVVPSLDGLVTCSDCRKAGNPRARTSWHPSGYVSPSTQAWRAEVRVEAAIANYIPSTKYNEVAILITAAWSARPCERN